MKTLGQLYVDNECKNDAEHHMILKAINHFGWIAKKQTLDHMFITQMDAIKDKLIHLDEDMTGSIKIQ